MVSVVRGLLPYPDPACRRRVRVAARGLVRCEPWPADDATTSVDVAGLALLRVLWLQRVCRRSALLRNTEAVILAARSSVEACILGLYCLHHEDVVAGLRAANIKALNQILRYLVDDGFVTKDLLDQSLAHLGQPGEAPNIGAMTTKIETATGSSGAVSLYRRFYVPSSTFFAHANAASLLRHVGSDDSLTERPIMPWTQRSAVHISDAAVGVLAAAMAANAGAPVAAFERYANAHLARAFTPLAVVAGRGLRRTVRLAEIPAVLRSIQGLRRYLASPQARTDPPEVRDARIREDIEDALRLLAGLEIPEEVRRTWLEGLVERLAASVRARQIGRP